MGGGLGVLLVLVVAVGSVLGLVPRELPVELVQGGFTVQFGAMLAVRDVTPRPLGTVVHMRLVLRGLFIARHGG